MVVKITSGKEIRGVIYYNENKVENKAATLLMACGFPRDPDQMTFKNKVDRFRKLTMQNQRTVKNAMHVSVNFSNRDVVDDEVMKKIAIDYMQRIGFGDQPFLLYRHYDASHPHFHIATVNIADGGKRIETFNIGKDASNKARKEIELEYGLIIAEDQKREESYRLRPVDLAKALYGKSETKAAISAIVREVSETYKFSSLAELNAVLLQFNVYADPGLPDSRMYANKGLIYRLVNEQGNKVGIPIKSSSIYGSPTLKNLEVKFNPNKALRKPYGERLKHLLSKALKLPRIQDVEAALREQGVRILLRENVQGKVYGVTFIDNATRVVFNGSALGKDYSAKALIAYLETSDKELSNAKKTRDNMESIPSPSINQSREEKSYPAQKEPVFFRLMDIALTAVQGYDEPDPFRKKKKKWLQVS